MFKWLVRLFIREAITKKPRTFKHLTDDERFHICKMADEGLHKAKIAEISGRNISTVYSVLKDR